ncbi:YciI family protein [Phytohabitans sp. LJ34]|uniref:YciI family protein n=1 Tax=Phytohabitans sp. LJ34 TaxID=3452217 RepID=UPI003F8A6D20
MKYMIMLMGSQRDYDMITGKAGGDSPAWTPEEIGALHDFMRKWNEELVESGEFVDARGLTAPVHARRVRLRDGVPVVTDGPYAETQEVLAGYNIVECESFDRATEIAAKLAYTPHPEHAKLANEWYVDVRPIVDGVDELEL